MAETMINSPYINHLITMIGAFSDPWGLKAPDSRHIFMNDEARRFTSTPQQFNIEGRRDSEFPAPWSEMAEELIAHDTKTCTSNASSVVIETHHWYGATDLSPFLSEKHPVHDENGNCIAILWSAKPVINISPLMLVDEKKPGIITTHLTCTLFTQSENETIFYLMQGLSPKEIANVKNIALKTVNNRIYTIFQKADVHSLRQLEAFCHEHGFTNYLPPHLLKKGLINIK
ncbi:MAG: hypothetical protein XXXJIFNMEKO3_02509 [Candidatus Erwinia impunctatus]|nr:hypothetical protein XXXJIFNMEKO_02509 [Culicoides impunctatus]